MKKLLLPLLISLANVVYSQSYRSEFGFRTENDSYLGYGQDQYYTNGLYLTYRQAVRNNSSSKFIKKTWEAELGQSMYNAFSGSTASLDKVDRPFAAYLYGGAKVKLFKPNESHYQIGLQIGIIGPYALGKEAQEALHKTFGFYEVNGWQFQVKNAIGLNASLNFDKLLIRKGRKDLTLMSYANLGNTFLGAGVGVLYRSGNINPLFKSTSLNSRLSNIVSDSLPARELFFFLRPMMNIVVYNATIQGGMFQSDKGPATFPPNRVVLSPEIGIMYAKKRLSLNFSVVFKGRELREQLRSHEYGSVGIFYRFGQK